MTTQCGQYYVNTWRFERVEGNRFQIRLTESKFSDDNVDMTDWGLTAKTPPAEVLAQTRDRTTMRDQNSRYVYISEVEQDTHVWRIERV